MYNKDSSYYQDLLRLAQLDTGTQMFKRLLDSENNDRFDSINWREQNSDLVILAKLLGRIL